MAFPCLEMDLPSFDPENLSVKVWHVVEAGHVGDGVHEQEAIALAHVLEPKQLGRMILCEKWPKM
jgi:hypothetical protein